MQIAERFRVPIITMIDTPGAYPGIGFGGERPERSHRAQFVRDVQSGSGRFLSIVIRRGRIGRGARDRGLRSFDDAAVQHLFGHLTRELRVDLVEEHREKRKSRRMRWAAPPSA